MVSTVIIVEGINEFFLGLSLENGVSIVIRYIILFSVILSFAGCRSCEVTFAARYNRGPLSLEANLSPNGLAFK